MRSSVLLTLVTLLLASATPALAGPGLLEKLAPDEEIRVRYKTEEFYRPPPDWLREELEAQAGGPENLALREGALRTLKVLVVSRDAKRFTRRIVPSAQAVKAEEVLAYPLLETTVWLSDDSTESIASSNLASDQAKVIGGAVSEAARPVPDDLLYDVLLGLRGWGMNRWLTADDEVSEVLIGQNTAYTYVDSQRRTHRWLCDTTEDNNVLTYEVWTSGMDVDGRPMGRATVESTREAGGKVLPDEVEWTVYMDFWEDDQPAQTYTIKIDKLELVKLNEQQPTLARIDWNDDAPIEIIDRDGNVRTKTPRGRREAQP